MKNIVKRLKPVWCLSLLLTGLLAATTAFADTGSDDWMNNGSTDLPPYQLTGWFFNPASNPFPNFADPSQQWTSQDNIDQINYWLSLLAQEYGNDPALASLGSDPNALALALTQSQVVAPEPVAMSLLGCSLAFMGIYAIRRTHVRQ